MINIINAYVPNIFKNITLQTEAKKFAILGRNGIGKSTFLMQFMKQNIYATKFEVLGIDLLKNSSIKDFSIVLQEAKSALYPLLDIGQYILALAKDNDINNAKEFSLNLFDRYNLDESIWHKYPHQLSIGQAKKVSLIIALLRSPKLLILDELNAGLDATSLKIIAEDLANLDTHIISATHDKAFLDFCEQKFCFYKDHLECF